jgi:hypothetical protein
MQNNPNTDNIAEHPGLDGDDWEIALRPYQDDPQAALNLGICFMVIKGYLEIEPVDLEEVIGGLDRGLEVLFTHTQLHDVSYVLFRRMTKGKLTVEEEKMLKALGVRF